MRVSIVVPDMMVIVDGVARIVDVSGLPASVHSIQWDGAAGEIEYGKPINRNVSFTDLAPYQFVVDRWLAAAPTPPDPVPPPTKEEQVAWALTDPVLNALVAEIAAIKGVAYTDLLEAMKERMP